MATVAMVAVTRAVIVAVAMAAVAVIETRESRKRCRWTIGMSCSEESRPSGTNTNSTPNPLTGIMTPPRNTSLILIKTVARETGTAMKSSVMPFGWRRRSATDAGVNRIINNQNNLPFLRFQLAILQVKVTMANHLKVLHPTTMDRVTLVIRLQLNHLRHLHLITSGTRQGPDMVPQVADVGETPSPRAPQIIFYIINKMKCVCI